MGENFLLLVLVMAYFGDGTIQTDTELSGWIEKIRTGDIQAEESLLHWILARITPTVRKKIAGEDWKDVRQKCCFEIWKGIKDGKYDQERGSIGAYVAGVVRNQIRSYFRSETIRTKKAMRVDFASAEQSIGADPVKLKRIGSIADEIDIEGDERRQALERCIEKLPEHQRMVVISIYFNDEKHEGIGLRLGKEAQQITELNRLAKNRLKKCLEKYYRS